MSNNIMSSKVIDIIGFMAHAQAQAAVLNNAIEAEGAPAPTQHEFAALGLAIEALFGQVNPLLEATAAANGMALAQYAESMAHVQPADYS